MNAETTISQEFSDSKWVVHAKVLAVDKHDYHADYESTAGESWVISHLEVIKAFKGHPSSRMDLLIYGTHGSLPDSEQDAVGVGRDYILYINPIRSEESVPPEARGAAEVNYGCGESKLWSEVTSEEQKTLSMLSTKQ